MYIRLSSLTNFLDQKNNESPLKTVNNNIVKQFQIKKKIENIDNDIEFFNDLINLKLIPKNEKHNIESLNIKIVALENGDNLIFQELKPINFIKYDENTDEFYKVSLNDLDLYDQILSYYDDSVVFSEVIDIIDIDNSQKDINQNSVYDLVAEKENENADDDGLNLSNHIITTNSDDYGLIANNILII